MLKGFSARQVIWALALLGMLTGCSRPRQAEDEAPDIELILGLDPDPPLFGRPCELSVALADAAGIGIAGAELELKGDMTHAGMVPVVVTVSEGDAGHYTTAFEWTMAGDWIVTVQAALPDGRVARRQFEVTVEIPGE